MISAVHRERTRCPTTSKHVLRDIDDQRRLPFPFDSPNRLIVEDYNGGDDNSVATLNPSTMDVLGLFRGDTIIVR